MSHRSPVAACSKYNITAITHKRSPLPVTASKTNVYEYSIFILFLCIYTYNKTFRVLNCVKFIKYRIYILSVYIFIQEVARTRNTTQQPTIHKKYTIYF